MEEALFIKCESEWTSDKEESSTFKQDVNPLDVKAEPYLKSDDPEDDEEYSDTIKEELIIEDVKEEPNDDDPDSGTFSNEQQSLLYLAITQSDEAKSCESTKECSNNSNEQGDSPVATCLRKESHEFGDVQGYKHKKSFHCKKCEKIFWKASDLSRHAVIHTTEKPFTCNTCSKTFRQKDGLKTHLLIHTRVKPHQCNICGKSFTRKDVLKTHLMRHKGEKSYFCPMCERAFINKYVLKTHMLRHKGKNPHLCSMCREAFVNPYVLKIHMKTHNRETEIRKPSHQPEL